MSIERWETDSSRSRIHFAVRHLVFSKTRGRFSRLSDTVTVPDSNFSRATVDVVIDASSIDTGVVRRDEHLRSADCLDVNPIPTSCSRHAVWSPSPMGVFESSGH